MSYATRYCPKCGLERREGERFCRNCGTALGTGQTSLHESPSVAPSTEPLPPVQQPVPVPQPAVPQPAVLPAPPSAPPPVVQSPVIVQQPAASKALPFKPLALGGGALLVVSALLPWISIGGASTNALDISVESLWNLNAGDGPIKIGFITIALGLLGAGLSFVPRTATVRRLCGSIALAVVAAFALQFFRAIDQSGGTFGDFISAIGIGVYLTVPAAIGLQISK